MKKEYIKPASSVIEIKEAICGHVDSQGRWHLLGNQFIQEYQQENSIVENPYNVFNDSLSSSSDFLKFNNKIWSDEW